jgi:hypothetical protein
MSQNVIQITHLRELREREKPHLIRAWRLFEPDGLPGE